jgi:hypothetical protein
MNASRSLFGLTALALIIVSAPGCSSSKDEGDDNGDEGALTESTPGQWVVDMAKVARPWDQGGYGRSSQLFFGLGPAEYGLCKPGEAPESCNQKPVVWDHTLRFGPQASDSGVSFRKPYPNDKPNPVIKTVDGKFLGPKGRGLNIIPLLKNTDPTAQVHLRKWMKSGDVLTFFHPEQGGSGTDRRVSHVAMHYDYKSPLTGKEYVHHIDNPNNYGPRYNFAPNRNMPFHVFRYQPKGMDAKKAEAYALAARSWAFIDDDLSPFAGYFDLRSQSTRDLKDKFVTPLLAGSSMAQVYCSGLAWTNLNLGVNFPLKPGMLTRDYSRAETGEVFKAEDCRDPASEKCVLTPAKYGEVDAASLEGRGKMIYSAYTPSDLANAWLDEIYMELPPEKRAEIAQKPETQAQIGSGFSQLNWSDSDGKAGGAVDANQQPLFVPVTAPENLKAWADAYAATVDFSKAMKAGNREVAAAIVRSFIESHQLKVKDRRTVTLTELIKIHNGSQPADADPEKYVTVDVLTMNPRQILRTLEMAHVTTRFVPPRIWADQADDVTFLPSGSDQRTESNSDIVYVGTVINCELLSASDGSNADACALEGAGGGMDEFSEGGADTSTYPHYAIPNGGERTHRRFDASTGPALMGKGTKFLARATTYQMSDVSFLLHTPELYAEGYNDFVNNLFANIPADALAAEARQRGLAGMSVRDYDAACTAMSRVAASQGLRGSCAPKRAIVLEVAKANEIVANRAPATGPAADVIYTFDLGNVCRVASPDAEKMTCPVVTQKPDGTGWDLEHVQEVEVSRSTHGNFALTMADNGRADGSLPAVDPATPQGARDQTAYGLCPACNTQGAHFNQWTLTIRNDR